MKRDSGFTLIELLVVMAIIGVLAGIGIAFLPSIMRSKEKTTSSAVSGEPSCPIDQLTLSVPGGGASIGTGASGSPTSSLHDETSARSGTSGKNGKNGIRRRAKRMALEWCRMPGHDATSVQARAGTWIATRVRSSARGVTP